MNWQPFRETQVKRITQGRGLGLWRQVPVREGGRHRTYAEFYETLDIPEWRETVIGIQTQDKDKDNVSWREPFRFERR